MRQALRHAAHRPPRQSASSALPLPARIMLVADSHATCPGVSSTPTESNLVARRRALGAQPGGAPPTAACSPAAASAMASNSPRGEPSEAASRSESAPSRPPAPPPVCAAGVPPACAEPCAR